MSPAKLSRRHSSFNHTLEVFRNLACRPARDKRDSISFERASQLTSNGIMKKATIKSATAKWQIIKLMRDRRCLFDRNNVMITDKFPPPAITPIRQ